MVYTALHKGYGGFVDEIMNDQKQHSVGTSCISTGHNLIIVIGHCVQDDVQLFDSFHIYLFILHKVLTHKIENKHTHL